MHDVIVVGAGVAGLTAAHNLAATGRDVLVVEARDRIGGRTHTVSLAHAHVDLGAAWVHDPLDNPLTPYLGSLDINSNSDGMWGQGMRVFARDGWLPSESTASLVAALYNFDPAAAIEAVGPATDRTTDGIRWYVETQLAPLGNREIVDAFLRRIVGSGITGDDPDEISLQGMAAYEGEGSGHNAVIEDGYRTLVRHLSRGLDIRLSTPVSRVEHSHERVTVTCSDDTFTARCAVVTTPLGVLKSGSIEFSPDLPIGHREALTRLGVKSLEKVAAIFDRRFWDEEIFQTAVLDDDHGFIWVHDFSIHTGAPTLVGLYNPAIAATDLDEPAPVEAFSSLLESMFGPLPQVLGITHSSWGSDPYSLGSYSYIPVGASADDMATLAEPVSPQLILAGEHTVPTYYGTVQAAWLSGLNAAEHVSNGMAD